MNISLRRIRVATMAAGSAVAASLTGCGENPYAPPPLKKPDSAAAVPVGAPNISAGLVADATDCAGAVQAFVGFDPVAQRDRENSQWLPLYYAMLGMLEDEGMEFSQRIEGVREAAAIWKSRSRTEQETRVQGCQAKYAST